MMESSKRKRKASVVGPEPVQKKSLLGSRLLEHITLSAVSKGGNNISCNGFLETFRRYQIAYIPNAKQMVKQGKDSGPILTASDMHSIFEQATKTDKETWTQETWNLDDNKDKTDDSPGKFLQEKCTQQRGYSSFILQHDKHQLDEVLERLPFTDLPVSSTEDPTNASSSNEKDQQPLNVTYGPGLWVFFGRNAQGTEALQGRVEHTDSIQHDGTWHYQLSGTKEWHVRPTVELLESFLADKSIGDNTSIIKDWKEEQERGEKDNYTRMSITCQEGDILVVNTRLWWHSTTLPVQSKVSLSYARDMYLNGSATSDMAANLTASMTNVDGLYAANDIDAGTIIFRESEMPDCELHRAKENANCEVVELEDGEGAIVSSRPIKSGEFFCILESDDDDDGEEGIEYKEVDKEEDD